MSNDPCEENIKLFQWREGGMWPLHAKRNGWRWHPWWHSGHNRKRWLVTAPK